MPAYNTAKDLPHAGFLTTDEVGKLLGISRAGVCYHIRKRHFGALRRRWYWGHDSGRNLRSAYFIPVAEIKKYLMRKIVEKYAKPTRWYPAEDSPDAILKEGQ